MIPKYTYECENDTICVGPREGVDSTQVGYLYYFLDRTYQ